MIVFAYDGLEPKLVQKFDCQNLKQKYWGKTDLSEFNLLRTIVLWASFLSGKNVDRQFPNKEAQWSFKVPVEKTFLKFFKNYQVIDLPAFNYDFRKHQKERRLLAGFFAERNTIEEYDQFFWQNHQKIKKQFFAELRKDWHLLLSYFNLADAIGHLSLGIEEKMKKVYAELSSIVKKTEQARPKEKIFIISDHGMKAIGRYGDHAPEGFFSFSEKLDLVNPKITDFYLFLKNQASPGPVHHG